VRPIQVDDSSYFKEPASGLSCGIKLITQQQYNGIALKTAVSDSPDVLMVRPDYPDITMLAHPVPNRELEFHIISVEHSCTARLIGYGAVVPYPAMYERLNIILPAKLRLSLVLNLSPTIQRIAMVKQTQPETRQ